MQHLRTLAAAPLAVCWLWPAPVIADEKNPDVLACQDKAEGDSCQRTVVVKPEDGEAQQRREPGVCRMGECCTLDYSKGSPPESVCTPCLTCQPGPADGPSGADGSSRSDAEPPRAGEGDDPPASTPKGRGCTLVAPGMLASPFTLGPSAGLLLLVLARRRRP